MESVETYVIIPHHKFKALEERCKKMLVEPPPPDHKSPAEESEEGEANDADGVRPSTEEEEEEEEREAKAHRPTSPERARHRPRSSKKKKKDLKKTFQSTAFKKLLAVLKARDGKGTVTSLDNLDELVNSAVTQSKRELPHEGQFFDFIFSRGLGHFVRNRWKIQEHYKGLMWQV